MKRRMIIFAVTAMLAALSACSFDASPDKAVVQAEYEYEPDIIRYSELTGTFSFRKDVEKTQTDYAAYYFEASINSQEREVCITATDRALACIACMLPKIEVVILKPESYDGVLVSGNRLYTSTQQWDSAEYIAEVLLTAYGEWGNYGLAYGYANYLCKEAGLDYREADGFQQMSSEELYDLNLLCFNENFVLPEDVEAAKNNACCFVNEYLSAHSEEEFLKLLSDSGDVEGVQSANEALESFYKDNGVECSLTEIRYQYGGVSHDYAAACEYACFYIEKDWQDIYWEMNPRVSENFLHEDYGEVREFFECNAWQMEQYQEFFGFNSYNNDLLLFFFNRKSMTPVSFYQGNHHTIYLENVSSMMHEYIHSLMYGRCNWESCWKVEGFARNYEHLYNNYAYDFWNYDYNNPPDSEIGVYVRDYIDWLGRPIDMRTDSRGWYDFLIHAYEYTDPNFAYETGASFVAYLVDQYGEKAVIEYVCSDDEYNTEWGKSYEELVQDWNDFIKESYSWYSTE